MYTTLAVQTVKKLSPGLEGGKLYFLSPPSRVIHIRAYGRSVVTKQFYNREPISMSYFSRITSILNLPQFENLYTEDKQGLLEYAYNEIHRELTMYWRNTIVKDMTDRIKLLSTPEINMMQNNKLGPSLIRQELDRCTPEGYAYATTIEQRIITLLVKESIDKIDLDDIL